MSSEQVCHNCVEVRPDLVTLPDWPTGAGPCGLCLRCISLMLESRGCKPAVRGEADWDAPVVLCMRRGDLAAAAQALGHANNISDQADQAQRAFVAALECKDLPQQIKAELHSDEDGTTRLAGPLGDAISEAAGSCSLEFVEPEQLAEGICNWLETLTVGKHRSVKL